MAAEVAFEFTGSPKGAEAALAALERKYDNLEQKLKRVAGESKRGQVEAAKSATEHSSALDSVAASSTKLIASYVSVGAAVKLVSSVYSQWRADIDKTAEAATKANRLLIAEMAMTGDLAQGPEVRRQLQSMPLATDEQAQALYAGLRGARPTAPLPAIMEQANALGPAALLLDEPQLKSLGALAGKLGEFAPEKSPNDVADLAYALQQSLGEDAGQLLQGGFERVVGLLTQKGMPLEAALSFVQSGATAGVEVGTLAGMAGRIETADQLLEAFGDPKRAQKLLGQKGAAVLPLLSVEGMATMEGQLRQAQTGDLLAADVRNAAKTDPVTVQARINAAQEQDTLRAKAETENAVKSVQERMLSQTDDAGARFLIRVGGWLNQMTGRAGIQSEGMDAALQLRVLEQIDATLKRMEQNQPGPPPVKVNRDAQREGAPN